MQVFALFGSMPYEGDDLLGVYSTLELARAAEHSYRLQYEFCDYSEFRIRALGIDSEPYAVPFFTSL